MLSACDDKFRRIHIFLECRFIDTCGNQAFGRRTRGKIITYNKCYRTSLHRLLNNTFKYMIRYQWRYVIVLTFIIGFVGVAEQHSNRPRGYCFFDMFLLCNRNWILHTCVFVLLLYWCNYHKICYEFCGAHIFINDMPGELYTCNSY